MHSNALVPLVSMYKSLILINGDFSKIGLNKIEKSKRFRDLSNTI
ncbi:MAG: hypothetical protein O2834_00800 [Crenarchaeota archaeon]|nr:hypothetical protein [Thermoproteota archaeon]HJJ21142.1 hypothetical protein [Nitrosopumilus sp.]MDA0853857.1 hypothetical protein [Thermoproteota archaeon]MDA1122753.1 hypothetical protein [Thermoproteota archaeon]HJJ24723.1 hypothetical protein [Nitrosopumilus sp.]